MSESHFKTNYTSTMAASTTANSFFSTDTEVKTMWDTPECKALDFFDQNIVRSFSAVCDTSDSCDGDTRDALTGFGITQSHQNSLPGFSDPLAGLLNFNDLYPMDNHIDSTTKSRKFSSLTQKRKKVVDTFIRDALAKSYEYDYGEFGSQLWSTLLLECFKAENDYPVTVECIMHWSKQTAWGRRMKRAYEAGIQSLKNGNDPLREFEMAKEEIFRKRTPTTSPGGATAIKPKSRKRKDAQNYREPDPEALQGFTNDHDYCKNPWLESFSDACDFASQLLVDDFVEFITSGKIEDVNGFISDVEV